MSEEPEETEEIGEPVREGTDTRRGDRNGGETATLHWEAEDGKTITFVGLQADFEQFDMIA